MEYWDLYDENRRPLNKTMIRGEQVPPGCYHLVADAVFLNSKGETLLQRRAWEKEILPGVWSITGGSALAGETMEAGCDREVKEEMGFAPDWDSGRILYSETGKNYHRDVFLFCQDAEEKDWHLQQEEVQDARWILPEKILQDEQLWHDLCHLRYWHEVFPLLSLESMRIRIPKGRYRHYKGKPYQVEGLALHSETLEPMVIYRALYGSCETWVRPAGMWNEFVDTKDGRVRRFAPEEKE